MTVGSTASRGPSGRGRFAALRMSAVRQNVILVLFVVVFVALTFSSPTFLTGANLLNLLSQQSPILIMGAAAVLVLVAGGLDLSIGAIFSLAGVVAITVTNSAGPVAGVVAALVTGLVVGIVNGALVTIGRINALIATIATSFVVNGLTNIVANSSVVSTSDQGLSAIALTTWAGVTVPSWIAIVVIVASSVVLSRTAFGRRVYATGGNVTAAGLAGVRTRLIRGSTFALSGVAAALAGALSAAQVSTAQSGTGTGLEFTVLTGIVVGGVSILGGQGVVWRAALGVLFIGLVNNGSDQLGLDPLYKSMILGVILLAAVAFDAWARKRPA